MSPPILLPKVHDFCSHLSQQFSSIDAERKERLQQLAAFIQAKIEQHETPRLTVICTHNSRRSHIGQLCLAVATDYYHLPTIETFSGGTESTAFNPRAVRALQHLGFLIETTTTAASNPRYAIRWRQQQQPYIAFSKRYEEPPNPTQQFAAILVCSSADADCPIVLGSEWRLALPFDDPKTFDDTPKEQWAYATAIEQIGRELFYALHLVKIAVS